MAKDCRWLRGAVGIGVLLLGCPGGTPDAPTVAIANQTNTTISGTIGQCTKAGSPYPNGGDCVQVIRAVPQGGACDTTPVTQVGLSSAAQSWTLSGLSQSTTYSIFGLAIEQGSPSTPACDNGHQTSTPPNRAPNTPILSGVTSTTATTITGSIGSCLDDGLPNGICTQVVTAVCVSSNCGTYPPTSVVALGSPWTINLPAVAANASFSVSATSTDGLLISPPSSPVVVSTPNTVAGCQKYTALEGGTCGTPPDGSCTNFRGVSATWDLREKSASDVLAGGFSLDTVWLGVNEKTASNESIEVGVSWGWEGQPVWHYYTAWKKHNGGFVEFALSGFPTVGLPVSASVVSCAEAPLDPACTTPWVPATAEYEHVARINGAFFVWNKSTIANGGYVAPKYGSKSLAAGTEVTCSSFPGNMNPPSKSEPTTFRMLQYRLGPYWSNIKNLGLNYYKQKTPSTSSIHDVKCCYGEIPNSPNRCYAAPDADFLTYLNATTPLVCQ